jgi:hypothetical protein
MGKRTPDVGTAYWTLLIQGGTPRMWGSREASSAIRLVPRLVCVCIILTTYFGWGKLTANHCSEMKRGRGRGGRPRSGRRPDGPRSRPVGWEALSQRSRKVAGPYKLSIQAARSDKRSPRQPQESTTDCDKQENSQDTAAEEQICAFLRSRYLNHANYSGPSEDGSPIWRWCHHASERPNRLVAMLARSPRVVSFDQTVRN